MPKFLEDRLKREYPNNPHAVFGTLNSIGAMHGSKETARGRQMEAKHEGMSTLIEHKDGKYETHAPDGDKTMHPHIGHALMHLASDHSEGIHLHAHQEKAGGPIKVHVMHEDGTVKAHNHPNESAMADHAEKFFGGDEE